MESLEVNKGTSVDHAANSLLANADQERYKRKFGTSMFGANKHWHS